MTEVAPLEAVMGTVAGVDGVDGVGGLSCPRDFVGRSDDVSGAGGCYGHWSVDVGVGLGAGRVVG